MISFEQIEVLMAKFEPAKTQADLARFLSSTPQAIQNWKKRNKVPSKFARQLASFLDLTIDQVMNGNIKKISKARSIPVVATTSCGALDNNHLQEHREILYNGDFWSKDLYCVIACGDSMAPIIEDGDEIICDPNAKAETGDMVHYSFLGETAVKVLVEDKEANIVQFVPISSSDMFKTRTIRLDDILDGDLRVVKVVSIHKLQINNRKAILKLIGRA